MHRSALVAVLLIAAPASGQPIPDARDVNGLLGKALAPADDVASAVTDLLLSRKKGKVASVTVLDDAERSITVEIAYQGLEAGRCKLSARAKDAAGQDVGAIPEASASIEGPAGKVRLTLSVKDGLPEGTTTESARIRVEIRRNGQFQYDTARWFALGRRWTTEVRPENVIVEATPVAVGTIPEASPTSGGAPPPILIRPDTIRLLKMNPAVLTPVQPQPTPMVRDHRVVAMPITAATADAGAHGAVAVTPPPPHGATPVPPPPSHGSTTVPPPPPPSSSGGGMRPPPPPSSSGGGAVPPPPPRGGLIALPHGFIPLRPIGTVAGLPKEVTDKNGRGPSNRPLPWFDGIRAPQGLALTAAKVTTIDSTVYQDANPQSGIWYYLPARFVVSWDPDNGHAVRITYGTAVGEKQPVFLSARLTAGIDASEVDLVRNLLRSQLKAAGVPFTELRPLPFQDAPQVSFKGELGQFDVPPEKVSVTSISDLAGEIELSLATDPVTTAVLQTTLTEGLGLPGRLTFVAAGPEPFSRTVPVTLRAPDVRSYRPLAWKRGTPIRNRTPFPLLVRNLHFLTLGADGTPTVYSYAFTDAVVPPQAQLRVKDAAVRPWLDGALKAWIEYAVREGDEAGLSAVRDEVGIGAVQATTQVSLETLTPFAGGAVARLVVDVRSRYFDPKDRDPQIRTVQFSKDGERASVGPIFLGDRNPDDLARPGDPLFSWRLSAVKADGTVAGPGPWTDAARLELFFGQAQVQSVLGPQP